MAMTQQTPWQGALFMLSFGLGTLPVMVGVGMVSASFGSYLKHKWVRAGAGLALIVFGIWTAVGILTMDHGDHETQGGHHDHHAGHQM
jgi:sulfite exporter TauE/SafE